MKTSRAVNGRVRSGVWCGNRVRRRRIDEIAVWSLGNVLYHAWPSIVQGNATYRSASTGNHFNAKKLVQSNNKNIPAALILMQVGLNNHRHGRAMAGHLGARLISATDGTPRDRLGPGLWML